MKREEKVKSTSLLIGAGFSVPAGYPSAKELNQKLLELDETKIGFHTDGSLILFVEGRPEGRYYNSYEISFSFTIKLIQHYFKTNDEFNYEAFYDYLLSAAYKDETINELVEITKGAYFNDKHSLISSIPTIYNQLVSHLLEGKYGNDLKGLNANDFAKISGYNGIVEVLNTLQKTNQLNIHTLNHDLFMEKLYSSGWLGEGISDGFSEIGSKYYGDVEYEKNKYRVRLEYYTGVYQGNNNFYKLHGSKDYAKFHQSEGAQALPDCFIKTKYGVGFGDFYKERKDENGKYFYDHDWFNYHAIYLSGVDSKVDHYKEPLLFNKLFELFKENLVKAEELIIIGYSAGDIEVNNIIIEKFDYNKKPVTIIDPYPSERLKEFASKINAKLVEKHLEDLAISDIK